MARPTPCHRVMLRPEAALEGATPDGVLDGILAPVPVPRYDPCGLTTMKRGHHPACGGRGWWGTPHKWRQSPACGRAAQMIPTDVTGLLALICVLPIALSPWPARLSWMLLVALAVAVIVDNSASGQHPVALLTRRRIPPGSGNPWTRLLFAMGPPPVPRPGSWTPGPVPVRSRTPTMSTWLPGSASRCTIALRPVRRGDQRAALVTARSIGPLGLAEAEPQSVPAWSGALFHPASTLPSRLAVAGDRRAVTHVGYAAAALNYLLREYKSRRRRRPLRSIGARAYRRADVMVRTCGLNGTAESSSCSTLTHGGGRVADLTAADPAGWPRRTGP